MTIFEPRDDGTAEIREATAQEKELLEVRGGEMGAEGVSV